MRVLIAEDDAVLLRLLVRALERKGHRVETVGDGTELLRRATAFAPDAVLADICMPACDGIRACLLIRGALPGVSTILMTGDPTRLADAARAGFTRVLLKPFALDELWAVFPPF